MSLSNYNNPGDLKRLLADVGLDGGLVNPYSARLSAMMNRRHLIAHRFDQNPSTGRGHHVAASLGKAEVERWSEAVDLFIMDVLRAL